MKEKLFLTISILLIIAFSPLIGHTQFIPIIEGHPHGPETGSTETVKVGVSKDVLDLIKTWDKRIWFFTSKENPIKSLDGLKKDDILACWGAELIGRVFNFLDAAGIKYKDKSMRIIGTGNPIFSGMENPPLLFTTWSGYEPALKGAIRVEFIENSIRK